MENSHKSLGDFLRIYAGKHPNWDRWLSCFTFAFNTTVNETTGYTPFEHLFGRLCQKYEGEPANLTPPKDYEDFLTKLKYALKIAYDDVRSNMIQTKERNRLRNNQRSVGPEFKMGQCVYLKKEQRTKLEPFVEGPYEVVGMKFPNVMLRRGEKSVEVHMDRLVRKETKSDRD